MWKFQDFPITQILREINFVDSRSAKNAIFAILGGCEFCSFGKFQPSKSAKMHKNQNSEPLNVLKTEDLALLYSPKLISRKI